MSQLMRGDETPCYGCGDRFVGCHSQCEKYKAFREESLRRYQKKQMEWRIDDVNWTGRDKSKKLKMGKNKKKVGVLLYHGGDK